VSQYLPDRLGLKTSFAPAQERIDDVLDRARELLDTPEAKALAEQLDALSAELYEAEREAEAVALAYEVDLPGPEVSGPDLDAVEWLLDPRRDYVSQLNAYRRFEPEHRRRPRLPPITERRCVCCGGPMSGRKTVARFCSTACKNEQLRLDRLAARRARRRGDP
jgi:hypothetical protein